MTVRPDFEGKVHPIWEMSRRLLQSFTDGVLAEELLGFQDHQGAMFSFLARTDFRVDGHMPKERPHDDMLQLPSGRKRKHGGDFSSPSRPTSPTNGIPLPDVKPVTLSGPERPPIVKKTKTVVPEDNGSSATPSGEARKEEEATTVERATGKGSRSEPYSQHELCCIYIARRIRMLDWDTISWSLSRFKTPTVAILSDARTAFDQYHDLIIETLKLSCWPEDSMYLIACAAGECLAALERGHWSDELKSFKNNRGMLYQIYMQKRIERLYRKSFESPAQKRHRRRRERTFGYEGLSIEDYGNLPAKKKAGARVSAREPNKLRKRRTKEEMQQAVEDKAAARALLKANGLKANGEAISDRRKSGNQVKVESPAPLMPPTFADAEARVTVNNKEDKPKKTPRRKYDIPEIERIAFAGDVPHDRRLNYDVRPEDQDLIRKYAAEKYGVTLNLDASEWLQREDRQAPSRNGNAPVAGGEADGDYGTWSEQIRRTGNHSRSGSDSHPNEIEHGQIDQDASTHRSRQSRKQQAESNSDRDSKSHGPGLGIRPLPIQMSITNLLDQSCAPSTPASSPRQTFGVSSFESAAARPFNVVHGSSAAEGDVSKTTEKGPAAEKPRSSMSLAALLN